MKNKSHLIVMSNLNWRVSSSERVSSRIQIINYQSKKYKWVSECMVIFWIYHLRMLSSLMCVVICINCFNVLIFAAAFQLTHSRAHYLSLSLSLSAITLLMYVFFKFSQRWLCHLQLQLHRATSFRSHERVHNSSD